MKKKKSAVLIIVILLAIGVSVIGVFAAGQIARSNSISEATAIKIACADAAVKEAGISVSKNEFRSEDGIYFYEIEFISDGTYRYKVNARTGQILDKTIPEKKEEKAGEEKTASPVPDEVQSVQDTATDAEDRTELQTQDIGVEKAKKIALADAGFKASEIVFSKAKQEKEDDRTVYQIEFFKSGVAEYEYKIDAFTGRIVDREREEWDDGENDVTLVPEQKSVRETELQTTAMPDNEDTEQFRETPAVPDSPASVEAPADTDAPSNPEEQPVQEVPSSEEQEEEPVEEADDVESDQEEADDVENDQEEADDVESDQEETDDESDDNDDGERDDED